MPVLNRAQLRAFHRAFHRATHRVPWIAGFVAPRPALVDRRQVGRAEPSKDPPPLVLVRFLHPNQTHILTLMSAFQTSPRSLACPPVRRSACPARPHALARSVYQPRFPSSAPYFGRNLRAGNRVGAAAGDEVLQQLVDGVAAALHPRKRVRRLVIVHLDLSPPPHPHPNPAPRIPR